VDAPPRTNAAAPAGGARPALVTFLTTALVGTLGLVVALLVRPDWFGRAPGPPSEGARDRVAGDAPRPLRPDEVFAAVSPSVVHVTTRAADRRAVFGGTVVSGTASGIVWDELGHVVTCAHIFDATTAATVTLSTGRQFVAHLVEKDAATDLAVVRIGAPPDELTPARIPPPGHVLRVGEPAYSVACPYGMGQSLSSGVVSGLDRRIRIPSGAELGGAIQTDAPLYPGSSGGALADSLGRVIGLNAAIQIEGEAAPAPGVGFAQPIREVAEAVPAMIDGGFLWFPRLGFAVLPDRAAFDVLSRVEGEGVPGAGAVVVEVDAGGRAAAAGLRPLEVRVGVGVDRQMTLKDVILGVGDAPVGSKHDLKRALDAIPPGDPVTLRVARRDGEVELTL